MKKMISVMVLIILLVGCAPLIQEAVQKTQVAWTQVPSQTPFPTYTPFPTFTPQPTILKVIIQTPTPKDMDGDCKPITNMDYSDLWKSINLLQAYMEEMPGILRVSTALTEKLYSNTDSYLVYIRYINEEDNETYSKRYVVNKKEFGWSEGVFSLDGQCWIDPPN